MLESQSAVSKQTCACAEQAVQRQQLSAALEAQVGASHAVQHVRATPHLRLILASRPAPRTCPRLPQLEAQQQEVTHLGGAAAHLAAQVEVSRAGVASAASNLESSRGRAVAAQDDVQRLAEENARLAAQLQRSQAEADRLAAKAEEARAAQARLEEVKVSGYQLQQG